MHTRFHALAHGKNALFATYACPAAPAALGEGSLSGRSVKGRPYLFGLLPLSLPDQF